MKLGIALGGGGVKGMAHVGALRIFQAGRIDFDLIVGSSAGAMVGALYAAGKSADEIETIVRTTPLRQWFGRDRTGMGLFSLDGMRRVYESILGPGARIENLPRRFVSVAVDIDTEREFIFQSGLVVDAVCASAAYPGLFAPVSIDEHLFIDGGALNPTPFDVVRELGSEYVVAIDLWTPEPFEMLQRTARTSLLFQMFNTIPNGKVLRVVDRSLGIMMVGLMNAKMRIAPPDVLLKPKLQNVGVVDFDQINVAMAEGERVALEALEQIKQETRMPYRIYQLRKLLRKY
jgi:NTE family protein